MSIHDNLQANSKSKSYIDGTRDDAIPQFNLIRFELQYSRLTKREDRKSAFFEYRFGLGLTFGYSDRIDGGSQTYSSEDSLFVSRTYTVYTGQERTSITADFIYNRPARARSHIYIGLRTELGSYTCRKMTQRVSENINKPGKFISFEAYETEPLEMRPSILGSLQGIAGLDLWLFKGCSFRTELNAGYGKLLYIGGSSYDNFLISFSIGLRNAW